MKETIYSINEEYVRLMQEVEEMGGELTPDMEQRLAINEEQWQQKLEAYAKIVMNYKAEAEAKKAEADRLAAAAKAAENNAERLKATILFFLQSTGRRKEAAGNFQFSLRDTEAVQVTDEAALPENFMVTKVSQSPDKKAIKEAIKGGAKVPGAELRRNTSLIIK